MTTPQLWVIAGPNGAGKTTVAATRLAGKIPIVDPDAIAGLLGPTGGRRPADLRAGRIASQRRRAYIERRSSFAVETTLAGASTLNLMRKARVADYTIHLIYIGLDDVALAYARVFARTLAGGHAVPGKDIERRYFASLGNLPTAVGMAHRALLLDNSSSRRQRVLRVETGRVSYRATELPHWSAGVVEQFGLSGIVRVLRPGHPRLT